MQFAHFSHIWGKPGMSAHQRYDQLWRELQLCDSLDYDYGFCVEHHFRPDESWISSPSLFAVGAGARTKRLRIGPMGFPFLGISLCLYFASQGAGRLMGPVLAQTLRLAITIGGGALLASNAAPLWALYTLSAGAMTAQGVATAAAVRWTRWG